MSDYQQALQRVKEATRRRIQSEADCREALALMFRDSGFELKDAQPLPDGAWRLHIEPDTFLFPPEDQLAAPTHDGAAAKTPIGDTHIAVTYTDVTVTDDDSDSAVDMNTGGDDIERDGIEGDGIDSGIDGVDSDDMRGDGGDVEGGGRDAGANDEPLAGPELAPLPTGLHDDLDAPDLLPDVAPDDGPDAEMMAAAAVMRDDLVALPPPPDLSPLLPAEEPGSRGEPLADAEPLPDNEQASADEQAQADAETLTDDIEAGDEQPSAGERVSAEDAQPDDPRETGAELAAAEDPEPPAAEQPAPRPRAAGLADLKTLLAQASEALRVKNTVGRRPNPFRSRSGDPVSRAERLARTLVSDIIGYRHEAHREALAGGPERLLDTFRDAIATAYVEYRTQTDSLGVPDADAIFVAAVNDLMGNGQPLLRGDDVASL